MNKVEVRLQELIPADHPALAGHFPGNPVVPGTLILERVCSAVESQFPGSFLREVRKVKFLNPLQAGNSFFIRLKTAFQRVDFECIQQERLITSGTLILDRDVSNR